MRKIVIPPIKSQGIKTKLVPLISAFNQSAKYNVKHHENYSVNLSASHNKR